MPDFCNQCLNITRACCVVSLGLSDLIEFISDSDKSSCKARSTQSSLSSLAISDSLKSALCMSSGLAIKERHFLELQLTHYSFLKLHLEGFHKTFHRKKIACDILKTTTYNPYNLNLIQQTNPYKSIMYITRIYISHLMF